MSGKYREAAACLYRQQRPDYTGETDRRIPFTIYGTNSRLSLFNNIPEAELFAFVLNYKALRKRNLEDKYTFVFSPKAQSTSQNNSTFSWVGIHRDLMGDRFYDETKFYKMYWITFHHSTGLPNRFSIYANNFFVNVFY